MSTGNPRPNARQRGYTRRWEKARETFLTQHPFCKMCEEQGRVTAATVVDHVVPHKGDQRLFWDTANWQALCKPHHDRTKQRMEKLGVVIGCDEDGVPLDPAHHWNRP